MGKSFPFNEFQRKLFNVARLAKIIGIRSFQMNNY